MLWSCTNAPNGAVNITSKKDADNLPTKGYYPLRDYKGTLHQYRQPVIIPHGQELNSYCRLHFRWEHIRAQWNSKTNTFDYIIQNLKGF